MGTLWISFMVGTYWDSLEDKLTACVPVSCSWPDMVPRLEPMPL